jgi:hypothetical protein
MTRRWLWLNAGAAALARGFRLRAAQTDSNRPLGVGKGIHPGRVVWVHDPAATKWEGPGDGHWWEDSHTVPAAVDRMMAKAVQGLTSEKDNRRAWQALFRHFGKAPYGKGEKVFVKVNFVGTIFGEKNVDPATYELAGKRLDYMNTSPQIIRALLRQLVKDAGVGQHDITVGDPLSFFPKQYHDSLHREFPGVHYLDYRGGSGGHPRASTESSRIPLYWSARPQGVEQDFIPEAYAAAKYLINVANLKAHTMSGVTLCAKNHFGSLIRTPPQKGYFDMHASLAGRSPGMGKYRNMVDLMGHLHLGGKTLVYFIDGLYPGIHPRDNAPRKWTSTPFQGAWAASLLASQDPVAIDSVGLDFLQAEWQDAPRMPGADDYLHEAALAEDPPSGTFYDPNHPVPTVRLGSLGAHEHWNNAADKQYSRNLGRREGIELVQVRPPAAG